MREPRVTLCVSPREASDTTGDCVRTLPLPKRQSPD